MAIAHRLKVRAFLEGVEVPVIACQVQGAPNSPAMCTLQIPPLSEGTKFLPRTLVHVFFQDFYETASPHLRLRGEDRPDDPGDPTVYEQKTTDTGEAGIGVVWAPDDKTSPEFKNYRYKVLFVGELVGFQWSKTPGQRSLVLQCQDLSNYWDYAYQWNNTDLFGPGYKAIFSGGSTNLFTDFLEEPGGAILRIIQTPSVQYPALKGLAGGLIHLLEAIGGCYYWGEGKDKHFAGENIFFSLAELRLHISQCITAFPDDDTASRLFNAGGYDGLFGRTLGNLGQQVSIRQALNALSAMIFHETYSIPSPLYVPGTRGTINGRKTAKNRDLKETKYIPEKAEYLWEVLNGIGKDMEHSSFDFSVDNPKDPAKAEFDTRKRSIQTRLTFTQKDLKATAARARSDKQDVAAGLFTSAASVVGQAIALFPSWTATPNKARAKIYKKIDEAVSLLRRASRTETPLTDDKDRRPARLHSHIFRPDVWFSSPPRCNVLFPEHYTQLNYARSFLQEPTRLLLKTNDEFFGEDELFDQFYFAPKGITLKKQQNDLNAILSNDILDHELFSGILPVFEKMGELNIFGVRSGGTPKAGKLDPKTRKPPMGKAPKIGLAQRTTNFLYFKYRFAARQMQITARFNPYLVPGFPGLIIDKYVPIDKLDEYNEQLERLGKSTRSLRSLMGTHFLGNFTEVVHNLDNKGTGTTSINVSYPREYDESVEFLGVIEKDQKVESRLKEDATRETVIASLNRPTFGALGPNFGVIQKVLDVTHEYGPDYDLPLYEGPRKTGTGKNGKFVVVGVTKPLKDYGFYADDIAKLVGGNPDKPVTFRAYRVTESVPRYRRDTIDLPAEEYIRPGWYGDIWHPSQIGKAYWHFFRTGSITDKTQISDPNGAPVGSLDTDAEDALARALRDKGLEDPSKYAASIISLLNDSSIAQAVAFLLLTYAYIKMGNLDVEEFIRAYCWRPIATMSDMFGSNDLKLSSDGEEAEEGIEGFHSRAFGQYENLFGLVTVDVKDVLGIERDSTAAKKGDVRKRRQDAIIDYVNALGIGKVFI